MKYLLIFLISLIIASPAYAVKIVKGTVPVVSPLQPPAINVQANFKSNVQSTGPVPDNQEGTSVNTSQNPGQTSAAGQPGNLAASGALSSQLAAPHLWVLIIIILAGAVALLWVWKGRKKA